MKLSSILPLCALLAAKLNPENIVAIVVCPTPLQRRNIHHFADAFVASNVIG